MKPIEGIFRLYFIKDVKAKFQCGSGDDTTDFDETEGDKATGNCEDVEKGNGKNK
jgi:hypothetical protein